MEGLCRIWATAILDDTRSIDKCPKMLQKRVNEILEELKEVGEWMSNEVLVAFITVGGSALGTFA